jgi:pimeloyl-ACP methyl ester carboxylesterase
MAGDVLDTVRENIGMTPVTIVGHSLGGRVALAALDVDASLIDEVVLLDIGPGPVGAAGLEHSRTAEAFARVPARFALREEARAALDGQGLPRPVVDWLLTNLVPTDGGFAWRVDRQALLNLRPALNRSDLWEVVERYAASIRCIRGGESDYVSDGDATRMEALGCRVITLPGAGHFVHVDRPKELLQALLSLLNPPT